MTTTTIEPALVLLSGGLDSAATLAYALEVHGNQPGVVQALSVDYGQRHARELMQAKRLADHYRLGPNHQIAHFTYFASLAGHSALTYGLEVPDGTPEGVPDTYVPQRNLFLFALAAARLESRCLRLLAMGQHIQRPVLYYGAHRDDWGGYPDCTDDWVDLIGRVIRQGSKLRVEHGIPISVVAPFVEHTKRGVVDWARQHDVPIEMTWSCYKGGDQPCGTCPTCIARTEALNAN